MYLDAYFDAVDGIFEKIRSTQREMIERAAEAVAVSLAGKGVLAVMDTGHMLRSEAFSRAGGLLAITPFAYNLNVENPVDHREAKSSAEERTAIEARTVAISLDSSKLKPGDVLIINSNSGRTANVIEVALQCKERSITTIAICSKDQMEHCEAAHGSGKKLGDVTDIVVDNCTPVGDAVVDTKDNERMCPGSGMAGAFALWAIQAEAVERLQAKGVNPTIYQSWHVGGMESVEQKRREYRERGV